MLSLRTKQAKSNYISGLKSQFSSSFKPLDKIRVLDLSRILVGPYCTMFLGDLGAEVIKVESPEGDETRTWGPPFKGPDATYYLSNNRNKKNLCLDIKKPEGLQIIYDLVRKSDILVENFAVGVTKKLKIDYETIEKLNPSIIYASVTAYGNVGPWSNKTGYDVVNQAFTGLMHITGEPDRAPQKVGVAATDILSALTLGNGILAALYNKKITGKGCKVETSLLESTLSALVNQWSACLNGDKDPKRTGSLHPSIVPCGCYQTKDGKYFTICCTDKQYLQLCEALEAKDLLEDSRFLTNKGRMQNREEFEKRINEYFLKYDLETLMEKLDEHRVPAGPVNSIRDAFSQKQTQVLKIVQESYSEAYGKVKQVRNPLRFNGNTLETVLPPGTKGKDNVEILINILGYTSDQVQNLREKLVIHQQQS